MSEVDLGTDKTKPTLDLRGEVESVKKLSDEPEKRIYMDVPTCMKMMVDAYDHKPLDPYVMAFRNVIVKSYGPEITKDIIIRTFGSVDKIEKIVLDKLEAIFGKLS